MTPGLRELRLQTNELPFKILPSRQTPINLPHLTVDIRLPLAFSHGGRLPQLAKLQIGNARQWHVKRQWRTPADVSPLLPLLPLSVRTLSFVVFEQALDRAGPRVPPPAADRASSGRPGASRNPSSAA